MRGVIALKQKSLECLNEWNSTFAKTGLWLLSISALLHFTILFLMAEAIGFFNDKPALVGCFLFLSFLPFLYVIIKHRSTLWQPFVIAGSFLLILNLVMPVEHVLVHDSANYHFPKILYQISKGSLELFSGWTFHFTTIISLQDNFSMLYYVVSPHPKSLVLANQFQFLFINMFAIAVLNQRENPSIRIVVYFLLILSITPFIAETVIMKPNVIAPSFWVILIACLGIGGSSKSGPYLSVGMMAIACAFLILTKATFFIAVLPFVVLLYILMLLNLGSKQKRNMGYFLSLSLVGFTAAFLFLAPYGFRFLTYFHEVPFPKEASSWAILPPNLSCGVYFWPQQISFFVDSISSHLEYTHSLRLTPDECWAGRDNRSYPEFWYGAYTGLSLLVLIPLLISFRELYRLKFIFLFLLLVPVFHSMTYSNSIFNLRLISGVWVLVAILVAFFANCRQFSYNYFVGIIISVTMFCGTVRATVNSLDHFYSSNSKELTRVSNQIQNPKGFIYVRTPTGRARWTTSFLLDEIYREKGRPKFEGLGTKTDRSEYVLECETDRSCRVRQLKQARPKKN